MTNQELIDELGQEGIDRRIEALPFYSICTPILELQWRENEMLPGNLKSYATTMMDLWEEGDIVKIENNSIRMYRPYKRHELVEIVLQNETWERRKKVS